MVLKTFDGSSDVDGQNDDDHLHANHTICYGRYILAIVKVVAVA